MTLVFFWLPPGRSDVRAFRRTGVPRLQRGARQRRALHQPLCDDGVRRPARAAVARRHSLLSRHARAREERRRGGGALARADRRERKVAQHAAQRARTSAAAIAIAIATAEEGGYCHGGRQGHDQKEVDAGNDERGLKAMAKDEMANRRSLM